MLQDACHGTRRDCLLPMARPSAELTIDSRDNVGSANALQIQLDSSDLKLRKWVDELNTHNELENRGNGDPAVVAIEVANQIVSSPSFHVGMLAMFIMPHAHSRTSESSNSNIWSRTRRTNMSSRLSAILTMRPSLLQSRILSWLRLTKKRRAG